MFKRIWKPLTATAFLVGTPSYIYYRSTHRQQTFDILVKYRDPETSEMKFRTETIPVVSMRDVNTFIRGSSTLEMRPRPGGIVWNYATASLASNDPIEDAHSNAIIQRDMSDGSAPGDLLFFAIMDGHSGTHTSALLSRLLISAVVRELSRLTDRSVRKARSLLRGLTSAFWQKSSNDLPPDADPRCVSRAIKKAFTNLDDDIVNAPLRLLASELEKSPDKPRFPDLSKHTLAKSVMSPAMSGSCAIMAVLDTAHRNLYVASTGDCRAVAGMWVEDSDGKGSWRAEVLSEDQTGRNPREVARIRSEHPSNEADTILLNGRVLGGLEPTRAFGDARYKWPLAVQETLNKVFMAGNDMTLRPPKHFKTPPYVTATPVVTHRKVYIPPLHRKNAESRASESEPIPALRFIVLATDGLWEQLSSEDVVSLVAGHLKGLKGVVSKSTLPTLVPTSVGTPGVEGKRKTRRPLDLGSWAFVDDNVGAHLVRNAFGGGDEERLRRLLSVSAPNSRKMRDDVTVTVLWWEEGVDEAVKYGTFNTRDRNAKSRM